MSILGHDRADDNPPDDDYYDDDEDRDEDDEFDCHMGPDGQCGSAGSEECDWECPTMRAYRDGGLPMNPPPTTARKDLGE